MLFNSFNFFLFLPIVLLVYYLIPCKFRNIWLLLTSYFFYMYFNIKYTLILLIVTLITYISSILIEKSKNKKRVVIICFILNLLILFFFKYFSFIIDIINNLFNSNISINIVLPIGISFYILQALGYIIDVYRKEVKVEYNFLNYALFVSFFPQLVAGPIERSKNLLKQIKEKHYFNFDKFKDGFLLMLWGFFLKIVIADRVAIVVNNIFNNYQEYGGIYIIIGTILFGIQIYCDFYGYSTIATGVAKMLDFNLMKNFDSPYLSKTISEFWRRWHISLSTWFKDYLYIPLGGNRKGIKRKCINLLIVFTISGLWHGANITFLIWGLLNGIFIIIDNLIKNNNKHKIIKLIITFILINFTWIFFRANNINIAFNMIKSIFTDFNLNINLYNLGLVKIEFIFMLITIFILIIVDIIHYKKYSIINWLNKRNLILKCSLVIIFILIIIVFGIYGPIYDKQNFIYFQF